MFSKKPLDYKGIKFKACMIIIGEIDLPLFFRNIEIIYWNRFFISDKMVITRTPILYSLNQAISSENKLKGSVPNWKALFPALQNWST